MKLKNRFQKLVGDERGNVMMTFSIAVPILLGVTGMAVDSAAFYNQQARMQTVADASSLAVAKELHVYRKNLDELKAVGKARVEALLTESGISDRPHSTAIAIDEKNNIIEVSLSMVARGLLPADVWGENPIRVTSQARAYGQNRLCVLALDGTKSDTIKAEDASSMTAPDCAVQSNSADPGGLNVSGDSSIVSTVICSSGGVKGGGTLTPKARTDCPKLDDPLASRAAPPVGGCTILDRVINAADLLSPQTFCGGLKIEKNAVVTLAPGTYVITGGKLEVKDQAQLIGENVSFYFADDASTFHFDKNTTIDLTAPKDGAMAGILFYESRSSAKARSFEIKSENAHRLLGTIYLPNGKLKIDSKGNVADESAYTVIVARQIEVKGANLVVNSDYGGTDVPVPEGVGPNSQFVALDR